MKAPYYPIIYVRGYAMTRGEIDETTADPFCGFNLGSTVFRAVPDKTARPRKFVFESPVVRLASEFGYSDVYEDGYDIVVNYAGNKGAADEVVAAIRAKGRKAVAVQGDVGSAADIDSLFGRVELLP